MDLMIDCMPLYEMIEDDMKNIINCSMSSSSSSPSCLSDEEQLALTSCSMFDDLFFLSIQQPQQQQQQTQQFTQSESELQQQITYSSLGCVSNDTLVETLEQMSNETQTPRDIVATNNQQRPADNHSTNQQLNNNNNFYSNTNNNNNTNNFNDSFCSFSLSSSSSTSSSACSPISANSNGNGASPLSLSLSSSSLFDALANTTFSSPPPNNNTQQTINAVSHTPNSVGSSNTNSTCSSSLSSPSTTPLSHQYNNFNSSSSSLSGPQTKQDSQVNSKYMDSIYYNNVNLYHVINPMDLNKNYNQLHHHQQQLNSTSSLHDMLQSNDQLLPSHRIKTISIPKQQLIDSTYSHQVAKRGKFSHNNSNNSDGESSLSNESDSNSSIGSSELLPKKPMNAGNDYSKPLIIATKIESFQLKNVTNNFAKNGESETNTTTITNPVQPINVNTPTAQINLIKINGPKENTFYSTSGSQFSSNSLKVPVTTTKFNSLDSQPPNHKTIIQYKQLVSNNGLNVNKPQQQQQAQSKGLNTIINLNSGASLTVNSNLDSNAKVFPKPPYSYSCLIAMALRNSDSGNLPVSDIYEFIIENFPYYKTARDGWKNSIRHNLSLNKCFEKIENPTNGSKKGCLWALNPDKCKKLEEECKRCRQRDPVNIRLSMSRPDDLNKIERGEQRLKKFNNSTGQPGARKTTPLDINTAGLNIQQTAVTTNSQISLSPAPSNNASASNSNGGSQQQQQISLSDDSFLLDWTNKNSSVILKEEDQYFDDSDIKFDPILLTGLNESTRNNI